MFTNKKQYGGQKKMFLAMLTVEFFRIYFKNTLKVALTEY